MSYTLILIIITALVSFLAFNNNDLLNKLILWPRKMNNPEEYYRLLTAGFIHADIGHLFFNMFALYFFGQFVEDIFKVTGSPILFIILYLTAIIIASLPSFIKHRNNNYYRSLGASGGVAAIVFSSIYFDPWQKIYFFFIPIGIPAIIFAVGYLIYSAYMSKKGSDNIGHDAHFWGAVYGFVFTLLFAPDYGSNFLTELMHPHY